MSQTHEIVRIRSGALAVRSRVEGEVMHPGVGPTVESEQLYVQQSLLAERLLTPGLSALVVFDIGLGAGSNAMAAWHASERAPLSAARMELVSFERDMGAFELALSQGAEFSMVGGAAIAAKAVLEKGRYETPRTSWRLDFGDVIESLNRESTLADIVFWDPFSPRANPDLWTIGAFSAMRRKAGPGCTLFTYSASTATRIALLLAGWNVGLGDPIGNKAATTAAACQLSDLVHPLDLAWLKRLARHDVPLPSDAPPHVAPIIASLPQFIA